jgi:hypothetical protein
MAAIARFAFEKLANAGLEFPVMAVLVVTIVMVAPFPVVMVASRFVVVPRFQVLWSLKRPQ